MFYFKNLTTRERERERAREKITNILGKHYHSDISSLGSTLVCGHYIKLKDQVTLTSLYSLYYNFNRWVTCDNTIVCILRQINMCTA